MTTAIEPMEYQARRLALTNDPAAPLLRHVLAVLDAARAEIDRLRAAELEHDRQHMLHDDGRTG